MKTFKILEKDNLTKDDLIYLMKVEEPKELEAIFNKAYEVKKERLGKEFSTEGLLNLEIIVLKIAIIVESEKIILTLKDTICLKKRL